MSDYNSRLPVKIADGSSNLLTSQVSGSQQALDVGINVGGVQIDPRQTRLLTATDVVTARLNDGSGNEISSTAGALNVNVSSGTLVVGSADKTAFTYGTSLDQIVGGVFQDTSPSLTAGQSGAVRLTGFRAWHTNLRDSSGNELLGSKVSASSVPVVIASDQGTLATKDQADGPVTPGSVASFSMLAGGQYNSTLPTLSTGQQAAVQVDSSGRILVSQPTAAALNATVVQSTAASLQATARLNDGAGNAVTSQVNGAQRALDVGINVGGVQIDPRAVTVGGTAVGPTNPVPVYLTTALGTLVNDYKQTTNTAAGSTDNHDYTVTAGKTLHLSTVYATASGRIKMTVAIETGVGTNSFTTILAGFSSTADPNIMLPMPDEMTVAAGVRVRVAVTNLDDQPFDLYSTISGHEQ